MMKKNKIRARGSDGHIPCKHRRRETRYGVTMDWCYAIGCCEIGDMPCEYCKDKEKSCGKEKVRKSQKGKAKTR